MVNKSLETSSGGRKYALISDELLKQLKRTNKVSEQLDTPQLTKTLKLDEKIEQVLSDRSLPDYTKASIYANILNEFFDSRKQTPEIQKSREKTVEGPSVLKSTEAVSTPAIPAAIQQQENEVVEQGESDEDPVIIQTKSQQEHEKRMEDFIEYIERNQPKLNISYSPESGELMIDKKRVPDSNFFEIIQFLTMKRVPSQAPTGAGMVLEELSKRADFNRDAIIPNRKLKDLMDKFIKTRQQHGKGRKSRNVIIKWTKLYS